MESDLNKNGYKWSKPVRGKGLSKEKIALFESLYFKGIKIKEIARILDISEKGVKQRIRRQKIANRHLDYNEKMIDQMFSLWQDRLTVGQIAIKMDIDKKRVYSQLRKMCLVG